MFDAENKLNPDNGVEKIEPTQNESQNNSNYQTTVEELEKQIRNNHFKSKEELFERLVELRENGMIDVIDNKKMRELLDLYDMIHQKTTSPIDTQNFSSMSIENNNLIISKETDRVLLTQKDQSSFEEEFKQAQNELSIQSQSGIANASLAFEQMANQKVEMVLLTINEAILRDDISLEILNKIRFMITSGYVNPNQIRIDMSKGVFYDIETSSIYEIKYNSETQEYEIYKNNELDYTESGLREEQEKEQERNKPKVRVLKKENPPYLNNAAFTKISFLVLNIISIALLVTMAILLNK